MGVWALFDFALLAAGGLSIAFSIIWRAPNLLLNLVFSPADLTAGMVLGIMLLITFLISIGAVLQRNSVTIGLALLNWVLVVDGIAVIFIGSWFWFFSLRERDNFHKIFAAQTPAIRIAIQDKLQCCGYFNSTDLVEIGGTFCADSNFVSVTNNATGNFCVTPITAFADYALNNTFSSIYGFMAVVLGLFLASLCVINKRKEDERFKKIDAKRGGGGFV